MSDRPPPISTTEGDEIIVRGYRLAGDLLGKVGFTEMFLLDMDGTMPDPHRVRMVDAVLVALMEHGITPSTLAARLVLDGAPEATQGAVAAGLLAVGSRFLGDGRAVRRPAPAHRLDPGRPAPRRRCSARPSACWRAAAGCPAWDTTCTATSTRGSRCCSGSPSRKDSGRARRRAEALQESVRVSPARN